MARLSTPDAGSGTVPSGLPRAGLAVLLAAGLAIALPSWCRSETAALHAAESGADPASPANPTDVAAPPLDAEGWPEVTPPPVVVKRAVPEESKHPTLRFLKENRKFFRAQLDRLRMLRSDVVSGNGRTLDPRFLRFREMLEEIRAGQRAADDGESWIRSREFLDTVADVTELESRMDVMDSLLAAQSARLGELEENFSGRQATSLVLLVTGVPSSGVPSAIVVEEDGGETRRIGLSEPERAALETGGSAQLLHELVEPRAQRLILEFETAGPAGGPRWELSIAPERDRMTFLEVDLASLGAPGSLDPARTRIWVR